MLVENALNIYTDGSSFSNPRVGGIGMVFVAVDAEGTVFFEDGYAPPGYQGASNNDMELLACVEALKEAAGLSAVSQVSKVVVHTDSRYVVDNYPNSFYWRRAGWKNRYGRPVDHPELWKRLHTAVKRAGKPVRFQWIKGHSSKNPHNKQADRLARQSAKNPINTPLRYASVARKLSKHQTQPGSVRMLGQRVIIRIVTATYLKLQKEHKYRYEVVSDDSPDCGLVDIIYSSADVFLRRNHRYDVTFNTDQKYPQIVEVHGEV